MGGLLTLNSFVTTFPEIDTTAAGEKGLSPAQTSRRSTVQGTPAILANLCSILTFIRNHNCLLQLGLFLWSNLLYLGWQLLGPTQDHLHRLDYHGRRCHAAMHCFFSPHLIVGRIVTGIGNGMNTSTVPTWQSVSHTQY